MLKQERQEFILKQINLHNRIHSADLSAAIDVSNDTIRRDISELAQSGRIIKVHGGAISPSFHNSSSRTTIYELEKKRVIAQKALGLIHDGMFILTLGGTTMVELARMLPDNLQATFLTPSITAAFEYAHHPSIEVIFLGDRIKKDAQVAFGGEVITKIRQIKPDLCIMGINAIDPDNGLTDNDWDVVQLKRAMIEVSSKVITLSISEKINTTQRLQICGIESIHTIITEQNPRSELLRPYAKRGIEIL